LTPEEAAHLQSAAAPGKIESPSSSSTGNRLRDGFQYQITVTTKDGKQHTFNTNDLDRLSPDGVHLFGWVQNELQKILAHKAGGA
jgi:hypothetical protein